MDWLLEKLGVLMDWIVGDRTTVEYTGEIANRQLTLRPPLADENVQIGVTITQITFKTHYQRWWLRPTVHSIYRVLAFAPDDIRVQLDQRLFQPQIYPLLCNSFLRHSRRPHLYALHAFLDRMGPFYPTIKCEI
jgi:hypothetical protein